VTGEASTQALPTIVLIDGQLTLTDGSVVDSRQPAADEKTAQALQAALTGCAEWWSTVSSIVVPTLDDSEGGFALILGRRSALRTALDGETYRSGLGKLLRGGVGSVSVMRSGPDQSLPTDYQTLARFPGRSEGSDMGSVGVRFDDPMPRWCFVDGNEYYLRLVANHIGARVLVDTTGELPACAESTFHTPSRSVEYCVPPASPQMVVVPDTARMRDRIDELLARRPRKILEPAPYVPGAPRDPADFLRFPVARAECSVTGLLRAGQWGDAAGLEAARMLVLRRFDLKLGLWDLALNPVLRTTVLDSLPIEPVPEEAVQTPAFVWKQAERKAETATAKREAEKRAVRDFTDTLQRQLASVGWIINDRGILCLPLTEPLSKWPGGEAGPLVSLTMEVNKNSIRVTVFHQLYNDLDISDFIERRREAFETLVPLPLAKSGASVLFWSANIGWDDVDADWSSTVKAIADHTRQWVGLLADFVASCREVRHAKYDGVKDLNARMRWHTPRIASCRVRRATVVTDPDRSDGFIAGNDARDAKGRLAAAKIKELQDDKRRWVAAKIKELQDARRRRVTAKIEELSVDYDASTPAQLMMLQIAAKHLDAAENARRAVTRVRSANAASRCLGGIPRRNR
jgi:hypothetical protein